MSEEFEEADAQYTREITCPWCGHEDSDSWEASDDGEQDCGMCHKPFTYERDVDVTYVSERVIEDEANVEVNGE